MICFSAECDELTDPDYGCVVTTGNLTGDKAVYFCDDGLTMKGEKKRKCEDDGMWGGTAPTCESKFQIINYTFFKIFELEHFQCEMFANKSFL